MIDTILMIGMLLALLAAFLYLLFTYQTTAVQQNAVKKRLDQFLQDEIAQSIDLDYEIESDEKGLQNKTLQNLGKIMTPDVIRDKLQNYIFASGIPLKANEFMLAVFAGFFFPFVLTSYFIGRLGLAIILASMGAYVPFLWLKMKKSKRQRMFAGQLVDTLVLISNGLKAGYSFLQALDMLAKEAVAPTSEEFRRVIKENSLGIPIERSLENLSKRMDSEDLDMVVTVFLIQREIGGNLAEILDSISDTIRKRVQIKSKIRVLTAQGRLSGLIVGVMPILLGFAIWVMNPEYMSDFIFWTSPDGGFKGYYLLIIGAVMQAIGGFLIKIVTTIDV